MSSKFPPPLKRLILTAGPTPVPERVQLAIAQPMLFHRTAAFHEVWAEALEGLKKVWRTHQPVVIITGTGTAGMEAAVANFFSPGQKALCIAGGRFGERWEKIAGMFGMVPVRLEVEWGKAVDPQAVKDALDKDPSIVAVFATASESSTGVGHPVQEIAELCRGRSVLSVVDAISAIGAWDIPQDKWGIDVLVGSSQKALMLPPGLAFVGVSERAWEWYGRAKLPRFYLDLGKLRASQDKKESLWTPAVSLVVGLRESLRMINEEGLDNVFARHLKLADATREACVAMGCELLAPKSPSPSVTAVKVPAGIDGSAITQTLRDQHGVTISGGQEQLKGKIFRVAHMGYMGPFDIITAVAALELTLKSLGHPVELGSGLAAAQRVLSA